MPSPPPLPEYRVSHQGTIRGPFPLQFLEAMVLAGQFPRDVKVMPSTGGDWTPLSDELGEPSAAKPQKSRVPDTKTVITWIFSVAAIAGVVAFVSAIAVSENAKKQAAMRKTSWSAASTPAPTPRYTPPARPSSTPTSYSSSSSSFAANTPSTLPASTPEVRRAIAASAPSTPVATPPTGSFYTDASGQTFSVSNYDYRRLQQMKMGLEAEEKLVEQQQDSLKALEQEVSRARKNVNRYSQSSVNSFNAKISNYNNRLENAQAAIDRFNRKVDEFNAELRRVGTPIR